MTATLIILAQTAADAGNLVHISAGATALAAIGTGVALVIRAARERVKNAKMTLQEPVPDIPVTMTRKYNPPTFSQHMEVVRRVCTLESTVQEIRREAAENYKELMAAGESRTNRMLDKMDDVARGFHSRVDDLIAVGAKPKPRTPKG